MAVGFTPKHLETVAFHELTQQEFLALAYQSAMKLDWKVSYLSENGLIAYTDNGAFSWNAEIKIKIENGIADVQSSSLGSEMMDWGKNKKNVLRFIGVFEELKQEASTEDLENKFQTLSPQFVPRDQDILIQPPQTGMEKMKGALSFFVPTRGFFVTPILIDLNILLFTIMVISGVSILLPDSASLLKWGANFRPMTLAGEWWRLLTNVFLHIGIFHLLMNMYALLNIGILLEPRLGRARFLSAYLLTGLAASATSLVWHDLTISAGASGAIFGMYGVFLAMLTTDLIEKTARKALLTSIGVFVVYNLMYGMKGGIDNAAHIGGLLSGILIGYAMIPSLKRPEETKLKFATLGLLTVLIAVSSFIVLRKTPNDIGIYDQKMKEFASTESLALEIYNLPRNTPDSQLLNVIKEKGIQGWNANIRLLDGLKELKLPDQIQDRNHLLKEYCELRLKNYQLLYNAVSENTDTYRLTIEDYDRQIEAKINQLKSME
jgi:rhomboid protease GluP